MLRTKTRRVKPPTRLFRVMLLLAVLTLSSCSLFKVYAGKVEYSDIQRNLHLSADSVHMEHTPKRFTINFPYSFRYEKSTYRPQ